MQFWTIILAAVVAAPALGAHNIADTVSKIQSLGNDVDSVQRALDSYNGGTLRALPVANAIYNAHMSAEDARKDLGNSDPFNTDEGSQLLDAYHEIHPRLASVLSTGSAKVAPQFKQAGVGYVARSMLSNLYIEKNSFDDQMKTVLSPEHYRMVEPQAQEIDREFKNTLDAYS
ncbi:uncharacterized protein N7482_001445 [Penicillium canariense]|uniref:Uncharacterized protein n=1 Tax=Penicillium canariense TaxID=189055 RepID=A0A9W9IDD3_9EURO|nr:uncharacterized protein N7482_001445 [Penicillium canariense]KAJ5175568.1 hypothetical protein N7482_001445 [Penicillium canariense]